MSSVSEWMFQHPIETAKVLESKGHKTGVWWEIEQMTPQKRREVLLTRIRKAGRKRMEIVVHTPYYITVRRSFTHSREWKFFRSEYLERNPKCVRCGITFGLQVHHKDEFTIDKTLIEEGFLLPLTQLVRFETLCGDCHVSNHQELIVSENVILSAAKDDSVRYLGTLSKALEDENRHNRV